MKCSVSRVSVFCFERTCEKIRDFVRSDILSCKIYISGIFRAHKKNSKLIKSNSEA